MNEWIFFTHLLCMIAFLFAALRIGKTALIVLVSLQTILANLFVVKQIELFGLFVTCSDVFIVGSLLALNLLQEFFGKEAAKQAIRISIFSALFFVAMSQVHLLYHPNSEDVTQGAFVQIFATTPRIVLASIAVFFFVQQIDMRLFAWLQKVCNGKQLPLRVAISLALSQTIDTVFR